MTFRTFVQDRSIRVHQTCAVTKARGVQFMSNIRLCRDKDVTTILTIVNSAAEAYRGVIPADRWHEPYMTLAELRRDIAAGVAFWGFATDGELVGVMGIQAVHDVDLIRHAYVLPDRQRHGVGAALIEHLRRQNTRRILVGTWAAANWAIDFYRRHGFALVSSERKTALLKTYWTIPDRQMETSVVLANPPVDGSVDVHDPSGRETVGGSRTRGGL